MCKDSSNDVKVSSIILGEIARIFEKNLLRKEGKKEVFLMQNMKNECEKK